MQEEKKDYSQYTLDHTKDVMISPQTLVEIQRFTDMVKTKHTNFHFPQKTTWYNRKTHLPIPAGRKISDEKLNEQYYKNISLDSTEKAGSVIYDEIGLSAVKLQATFEEIRRYNIDQGNFLEIPSKNEN